MNFFERRRRERQRSEQRTESLAEMPVEVKGRNAAKIRDDMRRKTLHMAGYAFKGAAVMMAAVWIASYAISTLEPGHWAKAPIWATAGVFIVLGVLYWTGALGVAMELNEMDERAKELEE